MTQYGHADFLGLLDILHSNGYITSLEMLTWGLTSPLFEHTVCSRLQISSEELRIACYIHYFLPSSISSPTVQQLLYRCTENNYQLASRMLIGFIEALCDLDMKWIKSIDPPNDDWDPPDTWQLGDTVFKALTRNDCAWLADQFLHSKLTCDLDCQRFTTKEGHFPFRAWEILSTSILPRDLVMSPPPEDCLRLEMIPGFPLAEVLTLNWFRQLAERSPKEASITDSILSLKFSHGRTIVFQMADAASAYVKLSSSLQTFQDITKLLKRSPDTLARDHVRLILSRASIIGKSCFLRVVKETTLAENHFSLGLERGGLSEVDLEILRTEDVDLLVPLLELMSRSIELPQASIMTAIVQCNRTDIVRAYYPLSTPADKVYLARHLHRMDLVEICNSIPDTQLMLRLLRKSKRQIYFTRLLNYAFLKYPMLKSMAGIHRLVGYIRPAADGIALTVLSQFPPDIASKNKWFKFLNRGLLNGN